MYIVRKYKIYMYKVWGTFLACFVASVYTFKQNVKHTRFLYKLKFHLSLNVGNLCLLNLYKPNTYTLHNLFHIIWYSNAIIM